MRVTGMAWLGTRAERFDEMVDFAVGVLGLAPPERIPRVAEIYGT